MLCEILTEVDLMNRASHPNREVQLHVCSSSLALLLFRQIAGALTAIDKGSVAIVATVFPILRSLKPAHPCAVGPSEFEDKECLVLSVHHQSIWPAFPEVRLEMLLRERLRNCFFSSVNFLCSSSVCAPIHISSRSCCVSPAVARSRATATTILPTTAQIWNLRVELEAQGEGRLRLCAISFEF